MEMARIIWCAMRSCPKGPPNDSYYAYMPARPADITKYRIWKSTEFVNVKREWEKRMRRQLQANSL